MPARAVVDADKAEAEPPAVEVQRADRPYASFYLSFTSTERDVMYDSRFFTELDYSQLRNGDEGSFRGLELAYSIGALASVALTVAYGASVRTASSLGSAL